MAAGRFDGFFHNNINLWDVAAGSLMVREAGGVAGTGCEEQLEAAVGLVHHKICVPVGASDCVSDQTLGALHFLFHDGFATPNGLEKRASRFLCRPSN